MATTYYYCNVFNKCASRVDAAGMADTYSHGGIDGSEGRGREGVSTALSAVKAGCDVVLRAGKSAALQLAASHDEHLPQERHAGKHQRGYSPVGGQGDSAGGAGMAILTWGGDGSRVVGGGGEHRRR